MFSGVLKQAAWNLTKQIERQVTLFSSAAGRLGLEPASLLDQ
jgi:hypothetical protein